MYILHKMIIFASQLFTAIFFLLPAASTLEWLVIKSVLRTYTHNYCSRHIFTSFFDQQQSHTVVAPPQSGEFVFSNLFAKSRKAGTLSTATCMYLCPCLSICIFCFSLFSPPPSSRLLARPEFLLLLLLLCASLSGSASYSCCWRLGSATEREPSSSL